jgi:hypothetical protein
MGNQINDRHLELKPSKVDTFAIQAFLQQSYREGLKLYMIAWLNLRKSFFSNRVVIEWNKVKLKLKLPFSIATLPASPAVQLPLWTDSRYEQPDGAYGSHSAP